MGERKRALFVDGVLNFVTISSDFPLAVAKNFDYTFCMHVRLIKEEFKMRIQSVQNQQMQNRPTFSAFKRGAALKLNPNLDIVKYLFRDSKALAEMARLSDVGSAKRFMSNWGDEVTLTDDLTMPIGILVRHPDGSTTSMFKTDTDVNPAFDSVVDALSKKPLNVVESTIGEGSLEQEAVDYGTRDKVN